MKPSPRDYLTIAAALIAILLCGYGIGFLVGERTTQQRLSAENTGAGDPLDWESRTLERLTTELELTPEQQSQVHREIQVTSKEISLTRARALNDYRKALLDLHLRVNPYLTKPQQQRMDESRSHLKNLLDKQNSSSKAETD